MSELMLVNPRRKSRRTKRRMSAKQALYFGGGARRKRRSRRRRSSSLLSINPRRRRRTSRRVSSRQRRRHSVSLRRNPIRFNTSGFLNGTLMPAAIGAAGAMGVDLAMNYASPMLPAMLQSGIGASVARVGGAIAVGMIAGKVGGRKFGEEATAGALVVTLYNLLKPIVAASTGLPLAGYGMGWISPGMQTDGLGVYVGADHSYTGKMHGASLGGMGMYVAEQEGDYVHTHY